MLIGLLILGLAVGVLAGLLGIAGGIFLIPALVFFFHFPQKLAQGTTLAVLLPPVGLGAAYLYWRAGNVDIRAAAILAIGFFIGGFFGAEETKAISNVTLSRVFGVVMLVAAVRMLLTK